MVSVHRLMTFSAFHYEESHLEFASRQLSLSTLYNDYFPAALRDGFTRLKHIALSGIVSGQSASKTPAENSDIAITS